MSPSDPVTDSRLTAITAELDGMSRADELPSGAALRDLLTAVTLLYGATVRRLGREVSLADHALTPTDVVVLCCALLRAQDLNPFDLTLWFGRVAPDPRDREPTAIHREAMDQEAMDQEAMDQEAMDREP